MRGFDNKRETTNNIEASRRKFKQKCSSDVLGEMGLLDIQKNLK